MVTLTASETRKKAREALKGNWGKAALILLIYVAIIFVIGILSAIPLLGVLISIAEFVILIPISYGLTITFMKIKRGQEVGYVDFLTDGFKNFSRSWCVTGRLLQKMIIPIVLYIVGIIMMLISAAISIVALFSLRSSALSSGVIFTFIGCALLIVAAIWMFFIELKCALGTFLAIDNPNTTAKDCINKSIELMDGNKGKLFCLILSFIGWIVLSLLLPIIFAIFDISFLLYIAFYAAYIFLLPYIDMAVIIFYENLANVTVTETVDTEGNVSTTEASKGNTIQEKSGSQDVTAEIVDIPELQKKPDDENN